MALISNGLQCLLVEENIPSTDNSYYQVNLVVKGIGIWGCVLHVPLPFSVMLDNYNNKAYLKN
jgi:hypothetical protein